MAWGGHGHGLGCPRQLGLRTNPGNSSMCEGSPGQRSRSSSGTALAQRSERRGEPACSRGEGSRSPAVHSLHRPGQKYISSLGQADFRNSILQANSPSLCLFLLCSLIFSSRQKLLLFSRRQSEVNFQQAACFPLRRLLVPIPPAPQAPATPLMDGDVPCPTVRSLRVTLGCFCCRATI